MTTEEAGYGGRTPWALRNGVVGGLLHTVVVVLTLTVETEGGDFDRLAELVVQLHPLFDIAAGALEAPAAEITVVLSADLRASVRQRLGTSDFEVERLAGGRVAAKTLPTAPGYASADVVMDARRWVGEVDDVTLTEAIFYLGHEFAHVFLARLRAATRPALGVFEPPDVARVYAIEAVEELRCDLFGDAIMQQTVRLRDAAGVDVGPAGSAWHLVRDGYTEGFGRILDELVHPGWPDLVDAYRNWQIDLGTMWRRLADQTRQVLTYLGHAQAIAIIGDTAGPIDRHAEHPGVQHYLGPAWRSIMEVVDGRPMLPDLGSFAAVEEAVAAAGEAALVAMWDRLGITSQSTGDELLHLTVVEPLR